MECVLFESLAVRLVLILRSAQAEDIARIRTRVRASRRMRTDTPSCFETHRSARRLGKHLRSRRAAMPLSMRARGRRAFWRNEPNGLLAKRTQPALWRNEPNEHFGQTNPGGEHARERSTNLRLHEMSAGVVSLFPAYYLQ